MGFITADDEFNKKHKVAPSQSVSVDDYEYLHSEAMDKLLKKWAKGKRGKGIDLEFISKRGNTIPVEVTILPSWQDDKFPYPEVVINTDRKKRQGQWFVFFNHSLTKFALVRSRSIENAVPYNGAYHLTMDNVEIGDI